MERGFEVLLLLGRGRQLITDSFCEASGWVWCHLNMEQPKILVAIRKRPLSKKETAKGETDIITVKSQDTVIVSEYK